MDSNIILASADRCTGCGACKEICPKGAIAFRPNGEGFPSPVIDPEQCVHCRYCEKVCPVLHDPQSHPILAAYAAQILDRDALKDSTSGGLFTAFTREIFRRGGIVYGCVWDEQYRAVVRKAENEEELKPMRGSKYVWSWAGDVFPEVQRYLQDGRQVMFTGLPCQVAGLKNYLQRDYSNLYLVDFFCGGAPSPLALQKYIESITKHVPIEKLNLKFRDKEKYGVGVHISYTGEKERVHHSYVKNPYFFSYHTKVFHRPSCYHCQYRYEQRVADLTIGDYWGVGKYHNEFDIRAGVSALLVSTERGASLLDAIKDQLQLSPTRVEDIAVGNNLTLGHKKVTFQAPGFRNGFFTTLQSKGWTCAERRYLYNKTRLKLWLKTKIPTRYHSTIQKLIRKG